MTKWWKFERTNRDFDVALAIILVLQTLFVDSETARAILLVASLAILRGKL